MPREEGSENQEGAISFETLRDEGQHFVHVQQFDKAIESFSKALELKPEDQHCLVTRSKCYLQVGNAEASLADAEAALEQNKALIKGLFQKAEALYQKGDFETALMFYHRGHRLRPELQEFRLGIQKSQEAINNSIGTPESVKLEANKGDMSYFYKQEEEQKAKAKKQQKGSYQKPIAKKEERKDREAPKGSADAKTVKQLLGELYGDKEYLEKLLKDQSLTGNNKRNDMSREIKDKVCDGLEYLYARADFWRQQKPMYARKRDKDLQMEKRASRRGVRGSMEKVLTNLEKIEESHVQFMEQIIPKLENIDQAQNEGKYQESLDLAKKTLKLVENASDEEVQNKPELIASLNSSIGNAYLEMNKLNQAMEFHHRDLDIAREHNLEDAKSRALDNLGRVYARKGDYEQAIEVWQEKIPTSKSALESTWLYHEIGRCYLELEKYRDAKDYGEKSLAAAQEAEDEGWQLHASVLVAQSEVKLGQNENAASSFEKALELARHQNDSAAEDAISKALEEINNKIVQGVKADGDEGTYDEDFETERRSPSPKPKQATPPKQASPKQTTSPKHPSPSHKSVTYAEPEEETPPAEEANKDTTNVDQKQKDGDSEAEAVD
ncbi:outer dynein arm-docking complex subunit 4-like [Dreissena polymorpha]|uniref:outer dynein arm-docking complex subunit 4-like n=1 Tax=Dreissena polymorpha TaxID=45954 RepID=UPI0022642105|nr:outer dynein arm-docking complex subunit 4-like [Dreissena polymorpha]XP_052237917.1 outer dynein arm-docking complex subunit 4-like [Dreissena polymorpha]